MNCSYGMNNTPNIVNPKSSKIVQSRFRLNIVKQCDVKTIVIFCQVSIFFLSFYGFLLSSLLISPKTLLNEKWRVVLLKI